jgi:uncharacterized protein (DUF2062 family)
MFRRHLRIIERLHATRLGAFVYHHLLHADDPPHRLALGAALGMFIALTPTMGMQSVLVIFFAWLLRANKAIGLPFVWITNPATAAPIYYPCYVIGRILLRQPGIDPGWWNQLATPPEEWTAAIEFYWYKFLEIALPLWVGCIAVGLVSGWITYEIVYRLARGIRAKRKGMPAS